MTYNRIVISSGHGKYIRGASGILDEVDEARKVVEEIAGLLEARGVDVKVFHDDTSHSQNENLNTIVNYHNAQTRDLDVSVHFNAYVETSNPMGVEVLYVTQAALADEVSAAIADCGFIDRGPKKRTDLFFLNSTEMPSILIETCFVDSEADADIYREQFNDICENIATVLGGESTDTAPPERPNRPERPERPDRPERPERPQRPEGTLPRPTLRIGDSGPAVSYMQSLLPHGFDGDFGTITEGEVHNFQRTRGLSVTGIVDDLTWGALEAHMPPVPPTLPSSDMAAIMLIANSSAIAGYSWRDRGQAPAGYIQGMALAFAQSYQRLKQRHPAVVEMSKANTHNDDLDAISWFNSDFEAIDMRNEIAGSTVLRHLYVMLLGLGMRESSGQHCEGRDTSASNTSSDTAEAGLFQTSYNAHSSHSTFDPLMDEYTAGETVSGFSGVFAIDVSCSDTDWSNYGSGRGEEFQQLCKSEPAFAVESCALVLRNLRQHYGPVNRKELELKTESDNMFRAIQRYIDRNLSV